MLSSLTFCIVERASVDLRKILVHRIGAFWEQFDSRDKTLPYQILPYEAHHLRASRAATLSRPHFWSLG